MNPKREPHVHSFIQLSDKVNNLDWFYCTIERVVKTNVKSQSDSD